MQKENENKDQDKKLLDLAPNLIKAVTQFTPTGLNKLDKFLKSEYINLSHHDEFEEKEHRYLWTETILDVQSLCKVFANYTDEEIEMALEIAIAILEKNRKKVLRKEVENA